MGLVDRIFSLLFPGSPAVNALLATLYISGPPNFLLALCPPNIDPSSLSVMVAFALGGILGDTVLHLVPQVYLGEASPEEVSLVVVDPSRNLVLGLALIIGFLTFVAMDKTLRIATGGKGHDHGHNHTSAPTDAKAQKLSADGKSSAIETSEKSSRSRKPKDIKPKQQPHEVEPSPPVKLSAYLNLIADFTHNITDGLAMSSSFYSSPALGATTAAAVFFHEIPHEVGDFALLIQSGFSKRRAMGAQFITAVGAFCGTGLGIFIQEFNQPTGGGSAPGAEESYLASLGLDWSKLLLAWTTGTFLYVGTVAVVPDLLEVRGSAREESWKTIKQFVAIAAGVGIMFL